MPNFLTDMGVSTKAYRDKHRLSQEDLADLSEVSRSTIQLLERFKKHNFTLDSLERVAKTIGLTQVTLYFTEPIPEQEIIKMRTMQNIVSKLHQEDILVLKMICEAMDKEIEKVKQHIHTMNKYSTRE